MTQQPTLAVVAGAAFEMTVDLNVLEHLGINLYSNFAAVLTEAVANAWDADAENVSVRVDPVKQAWIEIVDDGIGMSVGDLNGKYLRVGYRRRDEGEEHGRMTAKKRPVMGRKGLGKLALFSIANEIEVQSAREGHQAAGFTMRVDGIKKAVEERTTYNPVPIAAEDVSVTRGTRIVLRDIKRQRLGIGVEALRKRLARRFSVIGEAHGFKITIDGQPITASDRGDLEKTQFLWTFKGDNSVPATLPHVLERETVDERITAWHPNWAVRGWIGTAAKPKDLDGGNDLGNLNGIVVFARGRLIHENILDRINDGRHYTKYLTGQIEADFLDIDEEPDIATSDRQRIQEDDHRYLALLHFVKDTLNAIEKRWNEWRKRHGLEKAKLQSPALSEWLGRLEEGHRKSAETLIAKLSSLPVEDEEDRKLLYRHGIFAFERMKLRGSTEEFAQHAIDNIDLLFRLLADRDALEASLYRDIVKSRLEAIRAFQKIVDEDAKERVLQQYLFKHLWLLDPAWDRATGTEVMESALLEEAGVANSLTAKEKAGRVDIKYQTTAGKHVVVELKKVDRKMKLLELQEQGSTYVDKIKKILKDKGEESPNIEVVFVIGKPIDEAKNVDRVKASMEAVSKGSRIVLYDQLIDGARKAYAEYLQKSYELDELEKLVGSL